MELGVRNGACRPYVRGRWRGAVCGEQAASWLERVTEALEGEGLRAQGEVVRALPGRTVWRLAGPPAVYAKHAAPDTWEDRVRFLAWRSRVEQEWRNLLAVRARGLPVVQPLGWAERRRFGWHRDAVLLTRAAPGRPLGAVLEAAGAGGRRPWLEAWVRLLARAHAEGVWLRDVHPGNVLAIERGGSPAPELWLVDVQKARCVGRPLGARRRQRDVGMLLWTAGRETAARERHDLVRLYLEVAGLDRAELRRWLEALERERARLGARWAYRRMRRRLRDERAFRCDRLPDGARVLRRAAFPLAGVQEALARHRAILAAGRGERGWIKRGASTAITRVTVEGGTLAVKEIAARSLVRALGYLVQPHRALAAWRNAQLVRLRGWHTPEPLALVEYRRLGLPGRCFLLTRWEADTEELPAFLDRRFAGNLRERPGGRARGTWEPGGLRRPMDPRREALAARALGTLFGELHAARVYHADLKPPNLLVREDESRDDEGAFRFYLVDLEAMRPRARWSRGRRVKNLAQLADWITAFEPQVKRTHIARFLRAYLAVQPWLEPERRALVNAVQREVERKRRRRARVEGRG